MNKQESKYVQRSFNLPKEHLEKLNEIAKRKYVSLNDIMREIVVKYLKEQDEKKTNR